MSTVKTSRTRKSPRSSTSPAISAQRVRELLLEAAFALHATRVVGWRRDAVAPKKG
jgi:hypothetical protein